MTSLLQQQTTINDRLSQRFIALDPGGYFLISANPATGFICAEHFTNDINEKGLAVDPETGEPFSCHGPLKRAPTQVFQAKTAKELCIQLLEKETPPLVTKLDHAAYLGRELMRAELALADGRSYIQD
jgi:dihydropteroate synthase